MPAVKCERCRKSDAARVVYGLDVCDECARDWRTATTWNPFDGDDTDADSVKRTF